MLQLQYGNTLDLGQSGGWSYITISEWSLVAQKLQHVISAMCWCTLLLEDKQDCHKTAQLQINGSRN